MPTKTCAVSVKATAADDPALKDGQFTALASVFNNIDAVGDVVMPGAFTDNLKAWSDSGDPIPLLWGHQMTDPHMNIGHVLEASETDAGLQIKAELDLENPAAMQVYRLLKGRRVKKMSFAYDIDDGAPGQRGDKDVYELRKLSVHEVSVVQVPANPEAIIQQVKAASDRRTAHLKTAAASDRLPVLLGQVLDLLNNPATADPASAPKTDLPPDLPPVGAHVPALSAEAETTMRAAFEQFLTNYSSTTSNDGKANPAQPATAEGRTAVKTDSPALPGPASLRLRTGLDVDFAEYLTD